MKRFLAANVMIPALSIAMSIGSGFGCSSMKPGDVQEVTPVSRAPRAGNVYLLRGFIGIFSTGIDNLGEKLNRDGVNTIVFQDDQWSTLAQNLRAKYKNAPHREPIVLIGHSYGADDVVRIAQELNADRITVDLLVTLDPVTPPVVPPNVRRCINLYQSNGVWDTLPWLRGVPLSKTDRSATQLANFNIRTDRPDLLEPGVDHFNIEKKEKIHKEVIAQVRVICPVRSQWAMRPAAPVSAAAVSNAPSAATGRPIYASPPSSPAQSNVPVQPASYRVAAPVDDQSKARKTVSDAQTSNAGGHHGSEQVASGARN